MPVVSSGISNEIYYRSNKYSVSDENEGLWEGFLIRTDSCHLVASDILGSEFRTKGFKVFPQNLIIALALDLQVT
jgi:hypothetical protein